MALRGVPIEQAVLCTKSELFDLFCEYAGYFEDSPQTPYAISMGSRTLFSEDTADLRRQFNRRVGILKRKQARRGR